MHMYLSLLVSEGGAGGESICFSVFFMVPVAGMHSSNRHHEQYLHAGHTQLKQVARCVSSHDCQNTVCFGNYDS